jgi:hypothetical protein
MILEDIEKKMQVLPALGGYSHEITKFRKEILRDIIEMIENNNDWSFEHSANIQN